MDTLLLSVYEIHIRYLHSKWCWAFSSYLLRLLGGVVALHCVSFLYPYFIEDFLFFSFFLFFFFLASSFAYM